MCKAVGPLIQRKAVFLSAWDAKFIVKLKVQVKVQIRSKGIMGHSLEDELDSEVHNTNTYMMVIIRETSRMDVNQVNKVACAYIIRQHSFFIYAFNS